MSSRTATPSMVAAALARDRLGVPAVVSFVMSGVACLTVSAGVITTGYAVTGLTGIPIAFVAVSLVLGLFSVGYVAMARHITNAAALYAYVARGLTRPVGVGAALVALVAYNFLQVGLYGAFGPGAASYAADTFGVHAPWWVWAGGAWLLVTVLGLLRVDLNGKVLAVLLSAEVIVVLALTVTGLIHPAGGHVSVATLSPAKLLTGGVGAALVIAVLGYIGFEAAAIFSEEVRDPRRTVPAATYFSLGLIAVVYTAVSWAMAVHYGDTQIVGVAGKLGPDTLFQMAGGFLAQAGHVLYLTSLFAAMLAFHSFVTRYMYVLGREGVLPRGLQNTTATGAPRTASLWQSTLGLGVIVLYAVMGWDPLVKLFFWLGTTGGFGILALITVTSFAVVGFFLREAAGESAWHRIIAPGLASLVLVVMVVLAVRNYATLLGVAPGHPAAVWFPALFAITAVVGIGWGLLVKATKPQVYAAIGRGADAVTGRDRPDQTGQPLPTSEAPVRSGEW